MNRVNFKNLKVISIFSTEFKALAAASVFKVMLCVS